MFSLSFSHVCNEIYMLSVYLQVEATRDSLLIKFMMFSPLLQSLIKALILLGNKKRLWWSSSSWEYLSKRFSKKNFLFLMSIDKNGNCCQVFHHIYFLNNFPVNNFMNINFSTLLNVPHCWFPTFIIYMENIFLRIPIILTKKNPYNLAL